MNKKANILDIIWLIPLVVIIMIVLVFLGTRVLNNFNTQYALNTDWDSTVTSSAIQNNTNTIKAFNTMPIIIIGFGIIGVLFLASYLNVSGGLFFFIIIIALLGVGGVFVYTNILEGALPDSDFNTEKAQLPATTNLIQNLPYIIIAGVVLLLIVLYGRLNSA